MAVGPGLGMTVPSGVSLYRITSQTLRTASARQHRRVVNGEGAIRSRHGARSNYPGVRTVYLAETPLTCLAEKMFYFHREVLIGLDALGPGRGFQPSHRQSPLCRGSKGA